MTIHRSPQNGDNSHFLISRAAANDTRLTFGARGMLLYLLSQPDDYEINTGELTTCFPEGYTKIMNYLNLLKECGYIERRKLRENNRFSGSASEIYEDPTSRRSE